MPSFHMLRSIRAGAPSSRATVPSPSWSLSHYTGYLSACESACVNRLETLTCGQLTLLRGIASSWSTKDPSINRLLRQFESYFDPTTPTSLIHFVGLGGIHLFVTILCDTDTIEFARTRRNGADLGMDVRVAVMRVLTELLVCHNDFGWYLYDQFPQLPLRLIEFLHLDALRDVAIMLLEHMSSVVGPMLFLEESPELQGLIRTLPDAGLAALTRVLALSVVTGIMSEGPWRSHPEPFPQCLTRVIRTQEISDRNIRWLLDEENTNQTEALAKKNRLRPSTREQDGLEKGGTLLERLLHMSVITANGIRIFQGGRSVTVVQAPPDQQQQQQNADMTQQLVSAMIALGMLPANAHELQQQQQQMAAAMPPMDMQVELDEEDDEWSSASDDELMMAPPPAPAPAPAPPPTQPLPSGPQLQLLQNLLLNGMQANAPPASTTPGMWTVAQGGNGPNAASLQSFAASLSEDLTPVNNLDSISFAWFVSRSNPKGRWRESVTTATSGQRVSEQISKGPRLLSTSVMRRGMYDFSRQPWSLNRSLRSLQDAKVQSMRFVAHHRTAQQQGLEGLSPHHVEQMIVSQVQSICNAQSEIFFLLNTFLASLHNASWQKLTKVQMLSRLVPVIDTVFFLAGDAPRTVFARTPQQRNVGPNAQNGADRYEPLASRPVGIREVFWAGPSSAPSSSEGANEKECSCPPAVSSYLYHTTATIAGTATSTLLNTWSPNALRAEPVRWSTAAELFAKHNGEVDSSVFPKDESDAGHRHDPDTLRKLELVRTLFEYLNTQDRSEHFQLLAVNQVTTLAKTMAVKLSQQLVSGTEDACTETLISHTLESYCRAFSRFSLAAARANIIRQAAFTTQCPQVTLETLSHAEESQDALNGDLIPHILEQRIYNGIRDAGHPNSLTPLKRLDGIFALLGEIIKYDDRHLSTLESYVMDKAIPSPTIFTPTIAADQREEPIPSSHFSIARAPAESFLSVLQYRLQNFPSDTNLFVRALSLSLMPRMTCWRNYLHKLSPAEDAAVRAGTLSVDEALHRMEDVGELLHRLPQSPERSGLQLRRFFNIRRQSRVFVAQLCDLMTQNTTHSSLRRWPEEVNRDIFVQIILQIQSSPHALPLDQRPFPNLFGPTDEAILRGGNLPPAGLCDSIRDRLESIFLSTPNTSLRTFPNLEQALLSEPWAMAYAMISSLSPELMENTERICVVTSTLSLFLRGYANGGQALVDEYLGHMMAFGRKRYEERYRRLLERQEQTKTGSGDSKAAKRCTDCAAGSPLDSQCVAFVDCGDCSAANHIPAIAYHHTHGRCFAKHFFRVLCIWLVHYSSSQRYIETLYFCTGVPFAEWKVLALYVFRSLPRYFTPRSRDIPNFSTEP